VESVTEANPEIGFFQDVQQTGHRPPTHELSFDSENIWPVQVAAPGVRVLIRFFPCSRSVTLDSLIGSRALSQLRPGSIGIMWLLKTHWSNPMKHLIPYLQDDQKAADYLRQ